MSALRESPVPEQARLDAQDVDAFPGLLPAAAELEKRRRWTRDDWIVYALLTLERGGIHSVRIEEMARRSGRTPGSFYGYFANRESLLDAMAQDWQQRRTAQVEWTHRLLKRSGRYTLEGVVDDLLSRSHGEWVHPDLDLAMRLWSRHDPRARRAVQSLDALRLRNAVAMVRAQRPDARDAAELAVLLNWLIAGRHIVFVDSDDRSLTDAARTALQRWAQSVIPAPARQAARARDKPGSKRAKRITDR